MITDDDLATNPIAKRYRFADKESTYVKEARTRLSLQPIFDTEKLTSFTSITGRAD